LGFADLGTTGCSVYRASGVLHVGVPAEFARKRAVDVTGAPDAFLGALAHYIDDDVPLEEALRGAVHAAVLCIQRKKAQPSFATLDDMPSPLPDSAPVAH